MSRREGRVSTYSEYNWHRSAASERWGLTGARAAGEEAALAARVLSVRALWAPAGAPPAPSPRTPSPPPAPRKMRARRRQPRRLQALAPPPPAYCLDAPTQLFCDPTCKVGTSAPKTVVFRFLYPRANRPQPVFQFQFEAPRPPQLTECQRAMGRLSASVQAVMRASAARCPPYRGTNVSRYAPTAHSAHSHAARPAASLARPERRYVWWPRDPPSAPRLEHRFHLTHVPAPAAPAPPPADAPPSAPPAEPKEASAPEAAKDPASSAAEPALPSAAEPQSSPPPPDEPEADTPPQQKDKVVADGQMPSTSAAPVETGLRKKRLYSTVLSMSAPSPINLTPVGCVRLSQKLVTPGLLKLNSKIVLPGARLRPPNVDNKFEELEKEALEQYKASDESIDTKFRELEKQAVEQYSNSNSNTSCSSGNSAEKRSSTSPPAPDDDPKKKQPAKFHKDKAVDSVVIYSQNFPDLNAKGHTTSVTNLKNFHTPPRGEKKEQTHRSNKSLRSLKNESQRAASDTDYDSRESKANHKGPMRWTLHVVPPKKRHLTLCVSDFSSDEEMEDASGAIKAGPCGKNHVAGKVKLSAHGGGDLHPLMRKT